MQKIVLYGNGALTKDLLQFNAQYALYDIVAIIDDSKDKKTTNDITILSFDEFKASYEELGCPKVLVTIGYSRCNSIREKVYNNVKDAGFLFANFISPRCVCWSDLSECSNLIILDNVYIGPDCKLGNGVVIYPGTALAHDNIVGDFAFLSVSVVVGGNASIKKNSFIGLGVVIKSSITVEEYNVVASGANVIKTTMPKSVLKGNPATAVVKDTLEVKI